MPTMNDDDDNDNDMTNETIACNVDSTNGTTLYDTVDTTQALGGGELLQSSDNSMLNNNITIISRESSTINVIINIYMDRNTVGKMIGTLK